MKNQADTIKQKFYNSRYANQSVVNASKTASNGYGYGRGDAGFTLAQIQNLSYDAMLSLQQAYLSYAKLP